MSTMLKIQNRVFSSTVLTLLVTFLSGCPQVAETLILESAESSAQADDQVVKIRHAGTESGSRLELAANSCLSSSASVVGLSDTVLSFKGNAKIGGSVVLLGGSRLEAGGNALIRDTVFTPSLSQVSNAGKSPLGEVIEQDFTGNESSVLDFIQELTAATPDVTLEVIDSSLLFEGQGGMNVVRVEGDISLASKSVLKFRGSLDDRFIVQVQGNVSLNGQASIQTEGGILPKDILFILPQQNTNIQIAGNAKAMGTFFAARGIASLTGKGSLQGSLLAWNAINIAGNGTSIEAAPFCPVDWSQAVPPSPSPSPSPTTEPNPSSTGEPSASPSPSPTTEPNPSSTGEPSASPSPSPTTEPNPSPTGEPSASPSPSPSPSPTAEPSPSPTCTGLTCGILGT